MRADLSARSFPWKVRAGSPVNEWLPEKSSALSRRIARPPPRSIRLGIQVQDYCNATGLIVLVQQRNRLLPNSSYARMSRIGSVIELGDYGENILSYSRLA